MQYEIHIEEKVDDEIWVDECFFDGDSVDEGKEEADAEDEDFNSHFESNWACEEEDDDSKSNWEYKDNDEET